MNKCKVIYKAYKDHQYGHLVMNKLLEVTESIDEMEFTAEEALEFYEQMELRIKNHIRRLEREVDKRDFG